MGLVKPPALTPLKPVVQNRGFKGRINKPNINPKKDWTVKDKY